MPTPEQMKVVRSIVKYALDVFDKTVQYEGLLLCEGTVTSPDVHLYQKVYSNLLVVPVNGCTEIRKLIFSIRKRMMGYPVYGIIDRDSLSKKEIKAWKEKGVYCTKLPFIENIISCPEILKIFCEKHGKDYNEETQKVRMALLHLLTGKLIDSLPINIPIRDDEPIKSIAIKIVKNDGNVVEKVVDMENIIYAYRDKAVANETAYALGINGRTKYYEFFIQCLEDEELAEKIVKSAAAHLPSIPGEEKNTTV